MKVCAYCGKGGPLTREHVLPSFFLVQNPKYRTFISEAAKWKVLRSPPVIRDVCAPCNNCPLAKLDEYGSKLSSRYFARFIEKGSCVEFSVDYHSLLRWLLKISYNNARAIGRFVSGHKPFIPYILGNTSSPPMAVDLLVGLIEPVPTNRAEQDANLGSNLYPKLHRIGDIRVPVLQSHVHLARFVSFNSYAFVFIAWKPGTPRPSRRRAVSKIEVMNGYYLLRDGLTRLRLRGRGLDARSWIYALHPVRALGRQLPPRDR